MNDSLVQEKKEENHSQEEEEENMDKVEHSETTINEKEKVEEEK